MGYISITITLAATRVYVNWTKHVRHANQLSKYHIYFAMCHLLPVDFVMAALLHINCNTRLCMIGMPLQGYSQFVESYTYWIIRYTGQAYRTKEYDNFVVYAMLHYYNKEILLMCYNKFAKNEMRQLFSWDFLSWWLSMVEFQTHNRPSNTTERYGCATTWWHTVRNMDPALIYFDILWNHFNLFSVACGLITQTWWRFEEEMTRTTS